MLERKLASNPTLQEEYSLFMREYQSLGHMTPVNYTDVQKRTAIFLPHHAVIKTDSITSKISVVFDASCKTNTGFSLNDALMVGPKFCYVLEVTHML